MTRPHEVPLFDTAVTRLFGIRHPILCGGLMWLSTAPYVAAAARAGGIGFITARSFPDMGAFRAELQTCRELAGGNPFGVNLYLSNRESENAILERHVDVLLDEGVRAVETAGNAPGVLLPRLKEAGCTVLHKVSILKHAERAVRDGADAIAIVGMECGGHPGLDFIGSMVQGTLAPMRLGVPVVLGGGIGTGRQVVAALAMGAAGVILGTRMLVSEEIRAHEDYKRRIVAADERSSRLVLGILRNTYRVMDNTAARTVAAIEATGETDFEAYRPYVQGTAARRVYTTGDTDEGMLAMGQAAVFADSLAPVAAIYDELLADAATALDTVRRVSPVMA
ncbi:nitronate monooxygenase [Azospirillum sp.]|uniref:NAD(P)H-dependent flavin oxidoreductase n=1 Tax=Azospirillum sp. TaxID=34012 RepID=UPI002D62D180|nr:nitronate monooxygenase [Azospirillum sp.]HYD71215.1 nitronate monooxygenase [Azospirillum sp.]